MSRIPVIAVFDIGKTNKKLLLFDEQYRIVYDKGERLPETKDEDGFPCEDLELLTAWIKNTFRLALEDQRFEIEAVNFSGYGASFVHLDEHGQALTPLYNYLKPYPESLKKSLYNNYGGIHELSVATASPALGSLNSGLQLYRIKKEKPKVFKKIKHSLHLPQYLTHVLSGAYHTEITSVGCHTQLWDFRNGDYHDWVKAEGLIEKFPPLYSAPVGGLFGGSVPVGAGYHDSSSALIPYLAEFTEPFVLISTGTWLISMNPFNQTPLTTEELDSDCLCYLTPEGKQVKSSRYFGGDEHETIVKRISREFSVSTDEYKRLKYHPASLKEEYHMRSFEKSYHQCVKRIVDMLKKKTDLIMTQEIGKIYVDGGFSSNEIFMNFLANAYLDKEVYAATVPQASALGAALVFRDQWSPVRKTSGIVSLKRYVA